MRARDTLRSDAKEGTGGETERQMVEGRALARQREQSS